MDNRQAAFNELIQLADSQGYVTFDDIMDCADEYSLPIQDFDWLSNSITSRARLCIVKSHHSHRLRLRWNMMTLRKVIMKLFING